MMMRRRKKKKMRKFTDTWKITTRLRKRRTMTRKSHATVRIARVRECFAICSAELGGSKSIALKRKTMERTTVMVTMM
jgi:hypothetical protein